MPCSGVFSILSAMHCNTANGLAALDLTALCLVAAVWRVPLPISVEVCCEASVSLGSPLPEGSPVRASDACCHLRLIPFSSCVPGVPASARSAGGQLLGQSPSAILLLSSMVVRCLDNPLEQAVASAGPVPSARGASCCSSA